MCEAVNSYFFFRCSHAGTGWRFSQFWSWWIWSKSFNAQSHCQFGQLMTSWDGLVNPNLGEQNMYTWTCLGHVWRQWRKICQPIFRCCPRHTMLRICGAPWRWCTLAPNSLNSVEICLAAFPTVLSHLRCGCFFFFFFFFVLFAFSTRWCNWTWRCTSERFGLIQNMYRISSEVEVWYLEYQPRRSRGWYSRYQTDHRRRYPT